MAAGSWKALTPMYLTTKLHVPEGGHSGPWSMVLS